MLNNGDTLPDFNLPIQGGAYLSSEALKGKRLLLYFYPKDSTPGCTIQATDFTVNKAAFEALNTGVVGVSKDSVKSHDKFCDKYDLSIDLISDPDALLIDACGAWKQKSMYGRTFMGIERSTFLFDEHSVLIKAWPKVKAKGHAEELLTYIKSL